MLLKEVFAQAALAIKEHRFRAGLTMLGIAWGIVTVVVLMGYGQGFRRALTVGFRNAFSDGSGRLYNGQTSLQAGGERAGRRIFMKEDDVAAILELGTVKQASPEYLESLPISFGTRQTTCGVRGVAPAYGAIRHEVPGDGRFLSDEDVLKRRRVVFVGNAVAKKLFGTHPAGRPAGAHQRPDLRRDRRAGREGAAVELLLSRLDVGLRPLHHHQATVLAGLHRLSGLPGGQRRAAGCGAPPGAGRARRPAPLRSARRTGHSRRPERRADPGRRFDGRGADRRARVHRDADPAHRRRRRDEHHAGVGAGADARRSASGRPSAPGGATSCCSSCSRRSSSRSPAARPASSSPTSSSTPSASSRSSARSSATAPAIPTSTYGCRRPSCSRPRACSSSPACWPAFCPPCAPRGSTRSRRCATSRGGPPPPGLHLSGMPRAWSRQCSAVAGAGRGKSVD